MKKNILIPDVVVPPAQIEHDMETISRHISFSFDGL